MTEKRTNFIFFIIFTVLLATGNIFAQTVTVQDAAKVRAALVDNAKKYAGAAYEYGAIGPNSFDCSGFIYTTASESTGIQLPRTVKALYSFVQVIPQNQLEKGDIVFFRTTGDGTISHAGLYIGKNQFMHAVSDGPNTGVIISSLKESTWKNAYAGSGRFLPSAQFSDPVDEEDADIAVAAAGTDATSLTLAANSQKTDSVSNSSDSGKSTVTTSSKTTASKTASAKNSSKSAAGKTSASTKKSTSNSRKKTGSASKIVLDASTGVDWALFTSKRFNLNFRGIPLTANLSRKDWPLQPGIYSGFKFNSGCGVIQVPVALSITPSEYFRCYAGPVLTLGSAELPGDDDVEIEASIFPGIIGFTWNTPSLTKGDVKVSLYQDISYSVFNKEDGSALSPKNSLAAGLVFSTGIRVTLPFSMFF